MSGTKRPVVGIYRTSYPTASETFIASQASRLEQFEPVFIVRKKLGDIAFRHMAPASGRWAKFWSDAYAFSGLWPFFWGKRAAADLRLIHAHFGPDGMYGLQMARHLGIPLVVTFHGFDCTSSKEALLRSGVWSNIRFALFEDCLKRNADCFIAVSDFIKRCLVERGYPEDRIVRHYIGVDTDIFRPLPDKAESTPYVLCVARHTEKKGIDNLLRAFSLVSGKHAEVRLLLVGGGPLTDELKSLAADLSVSHRVDFMGPKPPGEVRRLMQEATVFALCGRVANSGDAEGLGIVFNEASACGIPIVATRAGGIPEAVVDGLNGYLVEPSDVHGFADRLDMLLSDPDLRQRMAVAGRDYVCRYFDLSLQSRALEDLYLRVSSS